MSGGSAAATATLGDGSGNEVLNDAPSPPRALFKPASDVVAELRRQQQQAAEDAADRAGRVRMGRWLLIAAAVIGWLVAALLLLWGLSLLPLRRDVHHFTVLNSADQTAAVYASVWDLPESKREQLILGTATHYVRACGSYNWAEAQRQYDYCAGLSAGQARQEYVDEVNPRNPKSPQAVLGQHGWRTVVTGKPIRSGPASVSIPVVLMVAEPNRAMVCARRIMRVGYVPVARLPTTLQLQYPTAEILFTTRVAEPDPTPLDPAACRL